MNNTKITVRTTVAAPVTTAWDSYTNPHHIVKWNFASPDWHCPAAVNDMRVGGVYRARMEAKDGSFGFDFEAVYTSIAEGHNFEYEFGGRTARVQFIDKGNQTEVEVCFDPETENPPEMQQAGWQAILNNYKHYTESAYAV